ncbi:DNA polymerase delta, subunit 4-domain-containing protein [Lyophyllum atratum]|nr:DNA polymerase delta, subunit 4-domain-containing protein [Lyophyllum atratum]
MPSTTRSSSSNMKQATLPFGTSKRTASTQNVKPKAAQAKKSPAVRKASSRYSSDEDELDVDDIHVPSSDEESVDEKPSIKIERRASSSNKASKTKKAEKQVAVVPEATIPPKGRTEDIEAKVLAELNEKDPKWRKHYAEVRAKMGHLHPIHGNGQTKIHEILRVFDMSFEYGPCVGISRLDRWERAEALGLNPPTEVRDILTTRQGTEERVFSQSVLSGEV